MVVVVVVVVVVVAAAAAAASTLKFCSFSFVWNVGGHGFCGSVTGCVKNFGGKLGIRRGTAGRKHVL